MISSVLCTGLCEGARASAHDARATPSCQYGSCRATSQRRKFHGNGTPRPATSATTSGFRSSGEDNPKPRIHIGSRRNHRASPAWKENAPAIVSKPIADAPWVLPASSAGKLKSQL
eukprot:11543001-Prorocentrum_lima.AAC.1